MSIFHNSTRVNRLPEGRDRATAGLRSNRFKASIIEKWLCIVLCLVFVVGASGILVPRTVQATVQADNGGYLLDRVITWADGSTEHVQIDKDGFFRLNGMKRKLVGMYLSTELPYGLGQFWLPENLAILDKELAYLESVGVRLIRIDLRYIRWWARAVADEEAGYETFLDLLYQHKMLVIAGLNAKWMPGFDSLTNPNFSWNLWSSWTQDCKPTFLYPEPGRSGGSCVGTEMSATQPFEPWPTATWGMEIPVQAGKSYPIGGWIRTENIIGQGGAMLVPQWRGLGDTWIGETQFMGYVKGTTGWTYYNGEVIAPPGATKCILCCALEGCSGKAWFDDITFVKELAPTTDSLEAWAERWANVVSRYTNAVAIGADNELDSKLKAEDFPQDPNARDQEYTEEGVRDYMTFLTRILRQRISVPITHNLMTNRIEPEIKRVCLNSIDIPAFDCYATTTNEVAADLADVLPWLDIMGSWWCLELNYAPAEEISPGYWQRVPNVRMFTVGYIDTVFNHGATIAILFWSSDIQNPDWGFFDNSGDPKPQLVEIAEAVPTLQAPISAPPVVATLHLYPLPLLSVPPAKGTTSDKILSAR